MNKCLKIFFSSILAGMLISIGGLINLSVRNVSVVAGGFLFAFGLFTIVTLKLHLFTGKVGYALENKPNYILQLLIILVGNAVGTISMGYLSRLMFTNTSSTIIDTVTSISSSKLSLPLLSTFILSIFCGIMMFLAVEVSRREVSDLVKVIAIFFAVAIFVIAGFEHCVANMYYFSFASMWSLKTLLYILIMILGNSIGSLLIYVLIKLAEAKKN